jgi:prepilin peptidase CpaA
MVAGNRHGARSSRFENPSGFPEGKPGQGLVWNPYEESHDVVPTLSVPVGVVVVAVLVTALTDVREFKIRNLVTLPLLVTGLIYHGLVGGWSGVGSSLLGVLFGFGVLIALYVMGGIGGGDVKLFAAVGAWLCMPLMFYVFIATALAAGVYALAVVLLYGSLGETWLNLQILGRRLWAIGRYLGADDEVETLVKRADRRRRLIPFAAMIAVGTLATFLWVWFHGAP